MPESVRPLQKQYFRRMKLRLTQFIDTERPNVEGEFQGPSRMHQRFPCTFRTRVLSHHLLFGFQTLNDGQNTNSLMNLAADWSPQASI